MDQPYQLVFLGLLPIPDRWEMEIFVGLSGKRKILDIAELPVKTDIFSDRATGTSYSSEFPLWDCENRSRNSLMIFETKIFH